jgi:hypothetical protein
MSSRQPPIFVNNAVEANLLEALMAAEGVPGYVKVYRDPAYHGVWTFTDAYGQVECPPQSRGQVQRILREIREGKQV